MFLALSQMRLLQWCRQCDARMGCGRGFHRTALVQCPAGRPALGSGEACSCLLAPQKNRCQHCSQTSKVWELGVRVQNKGKGAL